LPESVERLGNIQNGSITHLTREELEVYNALKNGGTVPSIADKIGMSTYDVMGILWKLEEKGIAERGSIETKKTEVSEAGRKITETKRQEYFIPTEEGKKLANKEEQTTLLPWHGMDIEFITSKPQEDPCYKHDQQVQNSKSEITGRQQNTNPPSPNLADGIDFSSLSTAQLKAFVTIPKFSSFAKQVLENRGYGVSIKNGKAWLRKKQA
jgi:DNA-binding MarR family transcriptional regulator